MSLTSNEARGGMLLLFMKREEKKVRLIGNISSLQGLFYKLAGFSAANLYLDAGTLVHLHVWLLSLLRLQRSHLRFDRLHQISQLHPPTILHLLFSTLIYNCLSSKCPPYCNESPALPLSWGMDY